MVVEPKMRVVPRSDLVLRRAHLLFRERVVRELAQLNAPARRLHGGYTAVRRRLGGG